MSINVAEEVASIFKNLEDRDPLVTEVEEEEVEEHVTVIESAGDPMFSEVFGYKPRELPDFPVHVYSEDDWDEEDKSFIPNKNKFTNYKIMEDSFAKMVFALQYNMKVLVVGPTGSGKTSSQELYAAYVNQPYLRINGRQDMETDTLLGKPWVRDGEMHFELGELPKALKKGWYITFDEPWKVPAGIQMSLQRFYEKDGILQIDDMPGNLADKQIIPDPRSRLVLADNVIGYGDGLESYGATLMQDASTLNRMDVIVKMDYMSKQDEEQMVASMYPALTHKATKLVQLFSLIRKSNEVGDMSTTVSPRNYIAIGEIYNTTNNLSLAVDMVLKNRFTSEESKILQDHIRTIGGL